MIRDPTSKNELSISVCYILYIPCSHRYVASSSSCNVIIQIVMHRSFTLSRYTGQRYKHLHYDIVLVYLCYKHRQSGLFGLGMHSVVN